jgi:hypothetical protein
MPINLNIDQSGGTYNINCGLSSDCDSGDYILFETNNDWITIRGHSFEISPTESKRTGIINTFVKFYDNSRMKCNNYSIVVKQEGSTGCGCGDIIIKEDDVEVCGCDNIIITNVDDNCPPEGCCDLDGGCYNR